MGGKLKTIIVTVSRDNEIEIKRYDNMYNQYKDRYADEARLDNIEVIIAEVKEHWTKVWVDNNKVEEKAK